MATGTVMNLGDPEWELIDPTPNVHSLFLNFDKVFFWTKLASRAVVRWSKRMYSCAGICSYEGRGGLCDIALSEPLLKLRPRKDLVETLLHEMIHAYLFITCRDQDRDGHGPNFKAHMHRINNAAGLNISIYHDFHDEVKLYQTHWWRCSGPCQYRKPYFGIVRRPINKAPGPNDRWFSDHQRSCGGTFVKIKEPEKKRKALKTTSKSKNNGDITKYINNNNNNSVSNNNIPNENILTEIRPILKDTSNQIKPKLGTQTNHGGAFIIPVKNINFKPQSNKPPVLFSGKGVLASTNANKLQSSNVTETVRNIWANKNIPGVFESKKPLETTKRLDKGTGNKRLSNQSSSANSNNSPPKKINKIDDYFKKRASSVLTEVYGEQINISQSSDRKLVAVSSSSKQKVPCPICNIEVDGDNINSHIDECLNKDVIEKLSKENITEISSNHVTKVSAGVNINKDNFVMTDKNRDFIAIKTEQENMKSNIDCNKNIANDSIDLTLTFKKINNVVTDSTSDLIDLTVFDFDYKNFKKLNAVTDIGEANISDDYTVTDAKAEEVLKQNCPCCDIKVEKPLNEHLDECSAFSDTSVTEEGASTSGINSFDNDDDDDIFDETQTFNATGTKYPCPCCLKMIEQNEMNQHLDECLL